MSGRRSIDRVRRRLGPIVRRYSAAAARRLGGGDEPVAGPFCTVVVRTQGARTSLVDTLTCLAAQADPDVETLVMVHTDDPDRVADVADTVAAFDASFASRVGVHQVRGGGRSRPLNAALELATGRYFAVLDDDDIVTSDWIASFRRAADRRPGCMVRSRCVVQWIRRGSDELAEFETLSGFVEPYPESFDLLDTIRSNRSPPCTYAVPMAAVREHGLRFDETLRVCEDWKFELDVARRVGVADDGAVTSVYRRWLGDGGSESAEDRQVWVDDHYAVITALDAEPTMLPLGSLARIHALYERIEALERDLGRRDEHDLPYSPQAPKRLEPPPS